MASLSASALSVLMQKHPDVDLDVAFVDQTRVGSRDASLLVYQICRWKSIQRVRLRGVIVGQHDRVADLVRCHEWLHPRPAFLGSFQALVRNIHRSAEGLETLGFVGPLEF